MRQLNKTSCPGDIPDAAFDVLKKLHNSGNVVEVVYNDGQKATGMVRAFFTTVPEGTVALIPARGSNQPNHALREGIICIRHVRTGAALYQKMACGECVGYRKCPSKGRVTQI